MKETSRRERERRVREEEMIDAAEMIFCKKGFDAASMDEIALEAQFTKSTLYQYFSSKEELYFAVIVRGFKALFSLMQNSSEHQKTGFMKICKAGDGYYDFYRENPDIIKLMNFTGYIRNNVTGESRWLQEFIQINTMMFKAFEDAVIQGQTDGSIRTDMDSLKMTCSLIFMLTGFFNQLSISGETFTRNFSINKDEFSHFSLSLLFNAVKG